MDIKTQRIAKAAAITGLKLISVAVGGAAVLFGSVMLSIMITGAIWPVVFLISIACFMFASWDVARLKVEREMREEEDLVRMLSRKHES